MKNLTIEQWGPVVLAFLLTGPVPAAEIAVLCDFENAADMQRSRDEHKPRQPVEESQRLASLNWAWCTSSENVAGG